MSGSNGSTPRRDAVSRPWLPKTFRLYGVYSRQRDVWVRDHRTGDKRRETKKRYDVRFQVDGHFFRYGFDRKGWADQFAQQLQYGFAGGLHFDPGARRFVESAATEPAVVECPSFVEHAQDYYRRQWHRWEPATRQAAQAPLALACLHLLRDDAPHLEGAQRVRADDFLRRFVVGVAESQPVRHEDRHWSDWFATWSLPLNQVTDRHLRSLLDVYRSQTLDGTPREAKPSSVQRLRAVVRAAFTNARKRQLISWDPWQGVEREPLRDHEKVDPDLVMTPADIRALAAACGDVDPRYEAYVLLQGFCGPRPGEATDLRRRDIAPSGRVAVVSIGGSHSEVPERFFGEGQERRRPLKGRGHKARRQVPLPAELMPILRVHLDRFVPAEPDAHVFTTPTGARINSSNFYRDVWAPARVAAFDEGNDLRNVRRHDLRHSAITIWLNSGVPLKTAQRWSGHKTLSVLLDTYLGVMEGDEELALHRLNSALRHGARLDEVVTGS